MRELKSLRVKYTYFHFNILCPIQVGEEGQIHKFAWTLKRRKAASLAVGSIFLLFRFEDADAKLLWWASEPRAVVDKIRKEMYIDGRLLWCTVSIYIYDKLRSSWKGPETVSVNQPLLFLSVCEWFINRQRIEAVGSNARPCWKYSLRSSPLAVSWPGGDWNGMECGGEEWMSEARQRQTAERPSRPLASSGESRCRRSTRRRRRQRTSSSSSCSWWSCETCEWSCECVWWCSTGGRQSKVMRDGKSISIGWKVERERLLRRLAVSSYMVIWISECSNDASKS